jgi:hypothetical protein
MILLWISVALASLSQVSLLCVMKPSSPYCRSALYCNDCSGLLPVMCGSQDFSDSRICKNLICSPSTCRWTPKEYAIPSTTKASSLVKGICDRDSKVLGCNYKCNNCDWLRLLSNMCLDRGSFHPECHEWKNYCSLGWGSTPYCQQIDLDSLNVAEPQESLAKYVSEHGTWPSTGQILYKSANRQYVWLNSALTPQINLFWLFL